MSNYDFTSGNPGVLGTAGQKRKKPKLPPKTVVPKVIPTKDDIMQQARDMVQQLFAPQSDLLKSAYETRNTNLKDAYAALAQMAGQIAPATANTYQQAGAQQAGFAQGFTGEARNVANQETGAINAQLANLGSPQQVTSGLVNGGANAIYDTGGYIPAQTFAQQGAAFTAANQRLPYTAVGLGVQDQQAAGNDYLAKVQELAAKQPEVLQSVYENLQKQKAAQSAAAADAYDANWNRWYKGKQLQLKKYEDDLNYQIATGKLNLDQAKAQYKQVSDQYDRSHPEPVYRTNGDGTILAIDPATNNTTTLGTPRPVKPTVGKNGVKPPTSAARAKALGLAEDFYFGVPDTTRSDGTVSKAGKDAVKYQVALNRIKALGFNLKDSQQILDTYYQRGEGGRPVFSYQERNALKKKGVSRNQIQKASNDYINATTPEGKAQALAAVQALLAQAGP